MTREEISDRAARLTMAVTMNLTGSAADMIGAATDEMVNFYRATLEEAARAVCPDCEAGIYVERPPHNRWLHYDIDGDSGPCEAGGIHDLIAALDKEAKGE